MSRAENPRVLRKMFGIKKLKKRIPISASEKAAILGLREKGKQRVAHRAKQLA